MRIAIIGAGVIGSAFARLLLSRKITIPEKLLIIERDEERCNSLRAELGCYGSSSIYPNVSDYDVVICAVKPQEFPSISSGLRGLLNEQTLVLSVMTGITTTALQEVIGNQPAIVRAMPNLPMIIGQGIVPYYVKSDISKEFETKLKAVLSVCGEILHLNDEDLIDAATAISGTGPGYVFYAIEAFTKVTCELGFNMEEAKKLISHTISGSSALYSESNKDPATLRAEVTSKGGTTEAAISILDAGQVSDIFISAVIKAYQRARELRK